MIRITYFNNIGSYIILSSKVLIQSELHFRSSPTTASRCFNDQSISLAH